MRVHHVERHLDGVERETVLCSGVQHFQMDFRTLMAGEADEANLARFLRLQKRFHPSAFGKNTSRVGVADHCVKLHQIDAVGLKTAQRLVDLTGGGTLVASIDLGHEKGFLAITVAQCVAHANFTLPAVVIPAVVEKIYSFIETRTDDTNAFLGIGLIPQMVATESNQRNLFFAAAQHSIRNAVSGLCSWELLASVSEKNRSCRNTQKSTT